MGRGAILVVAVFCAAVACVASDVSVGESSSSDGPVFLDTWAVQLKDTAGRSLAELDAMADALAARKGFVKVRRVGSIPGAYVFAPAHLPSATSGKQGRHRREDVHTETLHADDDVEWAEQQHALSRRRREVVGISVEPRDVTINDPAFGRQWHLYNTGQASGPRGSDLNVRPAWSLGYTGKGVVVTVLDDGLERTHEDLSPNYDPKASWDFNDNDDDPTPRYEYSNLNKHGTRCAGEIGSAKNSVCGIGVAYECNIGGVRMLDGDVSDSVEASSLSFKSDYVDVYSSSWGPDDDGRTVDGPRNLARAAFVHGVTTGRGGKGSIFVFASGNGGSYKDNCNCDGYTNSMYTISIGSVTDTNTAPWYTEQCAATMAVTYSSGSGGINHSITTCDFRYGCTDAHSGTSASAPLAAGIIALGLQANPSLTWRDVQHIVVLSSKIVDQNDADWKTNGAGLKVNHKYGFGVMDATMFVTIAKSWKNVGPQLVYSSHLQQPNIAIPYGGSGATGTVAVTADAGIERLEHVQVTLTIHHRRRGDLAIVLTSPEGTRSELLTERPYDYSTEGFAGWTFMTVRHWNESPVGTWTLAVRDSSNPSDTGTLVQWQLTLYGTGQAGMTTKVSSSSTLPSSQTPLASSYTPLVSSYTPPVSSYTPPVSSYTRPVSSYTPPVSSYTPPVSSYTPPVRVSSSVPRSSYTPVPSTTAGGVPSRASSSASGAPVVLPTADTTHLPGIPDNSDEPSNGGNGDAGVGFASKFNYIPLAIVGGIVGASLLVLGAVALYRRRSVRQGFVRLDADGEEAATALTDDVDGPQDDGAGDVAFANPFARANVGKVENDDDDSEELLFDA